MSNGLTLDRFQPPVHCYFVGCHSIWLRETRRWFGLQPVGRHTERTQSERTQTDIHWHSCPEIEGLQRPPEPGSWVALSLVPAGVEQGIPSIHRLYQQRVSVAIVGSAELERYRVALSAAGAVLLVTNIFNCDRLARSIHQLAVSQPHVVTEWKSRFVNRLPWSPVSRVNPALPPATTSNIHLQD